MKLASKIAIVTCSILLGAGSTALAQSGTSATGKTANPSPDAQDAVGSTAQANDPVNPEGCDPAAKAGSKKYCVPEAGGKPAAGGATTGTSGTTSGSDTGAGASDKGADAKGANAEGIDASKNTITPSPSSPKPTTPPQ